MALRLLLGGARGPPAGARGLAASALERVMTVLDGKLAEIKVHQHLYDSELVGEDANGNKYYEIKKGVQYGRHRYVVYKDAHIDYSPATVPAEWHGWLHSMNDEPPTRVQYLEPSYSGDLAKAPPAYVPGVHQPKGSLAHGHVRNWKKYEAWDHAQAGK